MQEFYQILLLRHLHAEDIDLRFLFKNFGDIKALCEITLIKKYLRDCYQLHCSHKALSC